MRRSTPSNPHKLLCASLIAAATACTPGRSDSDSPPPDPDTEAPDTGTDVIVVAPHCQLNEVEPNNRPGEEQTIELEQLACGALQQNLDGDLWRFSIERATWIGILLDAEKLGSRVDGILTLQGSEIAQQTNSPGSLDPIMRFPTDSGASDFTILVTDHQAIGDTEGYEYELLVTEIKQPVDSNRNEAEPNNDAAHAQLVFDGDAVFGYADGFSADWFTIDIPPGKHELTVDVAAWEYGSTGVFDVYVFDEAGTRRTQTYAMAGYADAVLHTTSTGGERLTLNIEERMNHQGRPYWYVARFSLVAQ